MKKHLVLALLLLAVALVGFDACEHNRCGDVVSGFVINLGCE